MDFHTYRLSIPNNKGTKGSMVWFFRLVTIDKKNKKRSTARGLLE
jgi:hypothetical protein